MATGHAGVRAATTLRAGGAESRLVVAVSSAVTAVRSALQIFILSVIAVARRRCRRPTAHQHRRSSSSPSSLCPGPLGASPIHYSRADRNSHQAVTGGAQGVGGTTQGITFRIVLRRWATMCPRQNDSDPTLAELAYFNVSVFPSDLQGTPFQSASRRRAAASWTVFTRYAAACNQQKRSNGSSMRHRRPRRAGKPYGGSYQISGGALFRVDCRIARQTRSDVTGISKWATP
jgi:hypothetical protein